ncbi:FecR family protein [Chitinophaga sp. Cy-1792]|uniref:FecR family protein n=1 Tax=Chitinophaga sp. Cy-1792 TaxID=2608339 RepID=UPI00142332FF|nr:FecR family protein [Chitinophaga sp. Cy-1792]NIG55488.1 DUF4974 domain-containing protein [Chitinophaga sp. Cy-1792]
MSINKYWILKAKQLNNAATPDELSELSLLSACMDADTRVDNGLHNIWHAQSYTSNELDRERWMMLLSARVPEISLQQPEVLSVKTRRSRKLVFLISLIIISLLTAGGALFFHFIRPVPAHEISAIRGTKTRATLPDGSVVNLNAGSRLLYQNDYGQKERHLLLSGEAFFDVSRIPDVPFAVTTGNITLRAYGSSSFNLCAYPEDNNISASLTEGCIQLIYMQPQGNTSVVLQSGQKIILHKDPQHPGMYQAQWSQIKHSAGEIQESAWKDNMLVVENERFEHLATRLERWYDVKIIFNNSLLRQLTFSSVSKGKNVQEMLSVLSRNSGKFSYIYNPTAKTVTIYAK